MKRKDEADCVREFAFVDGERTFTCSVAPRRPSDSEQWWWFVVSDGTHRYAPFLAASSDTVESVSSRMVAYYNDYLARRAAPAPSRWHRPPAAVKAPTTNAT